VVELQVIPKVSTTDGVSRAKDFGYRLTSARRLGTRPVIGRATAGRGAALLHWTMSTLASVDCPAVMVVGDAAIDRVTGGHAQTTRGGHTHR